LSQPQSSRPALRSPLETWFQTSWSPQPATEKVALRFRDCSGRPRFGCKGPAAQAWLASAGFAVTPLPNTARFASGELVARVATSEFLIESLSEAHGHVESTAQQLDHGRRPPGVYPVARQDLVVEIAGIAVNALLRQICSVDFSYHFAARDPDTHPIILTSMAGVGVVAWPRQARSEQAVTLWIDPSFAHYFWTTLLTVGRDLGDLVILKSNGAQE
jgi:sarcosine oxidase subunit gamma